MLKLNSNVHRHLNAFVGFLTLISKLNAKLNNPLSHLLLPYPTLVYIILRGRQSTPAPCPNLQHSMHLNQILPLGRLPTRVKEMAAKTYKEISRPVDHLPRSYYQSLRYLGKYLIIHQTRCPKHYFRVLILGVSYFIYASPIKFLHLRQRNSKSRESKLVRWANEDMIPLDFDGEEDRMVNDFGIADELLDEDIPLKPSMGRGAVSAVKYYGST